MLTPELEDLQRRLGLLSTRVVSIFTDAFTRDAAGELSDSDRGAVVEAMRTAAGEDVYDKLLETERRLVFCDLVASKIVKDIEAHTNRENANRRMEQALSGMPTPKEMAREILENPDLSPVDSSYHKAAKVSLMVMDATHAFIKGGNPETMTVGELKAVIHAKFVELIPLHFSVEEMRSLLVLMLSNKTLDALYAAAHRSFREGTISNNPPQPGAS